ncbi:helical backbone metal receptor [Mucilaginibacter gynuensis]|uniref:Helical backbone metal receptor n=1 Tax=Mucilaginibacter gynuensis TaxID=1302236 RepID=A0ABP8FYG3_9SPHI
MPLFYDQLNRPVNLQAIPKRIISAVPSQTELLFYLGLDAAIAGVTKFCSHPADKVKSIPKIGGTKQLNIPLIKELAPDLIIANKEENDQIQIEELSEHFPVWISDVSDLPGALAMISSLGTITGKQEPAEALTRQITDDFTNLQIAHTGKRALYLIWRNPYMAAGQHTFIDSLLPYCGLMNAVDESRYPEITAAKLKNINPDVILLSSEPYPFREKHIAELQTLLPLANIILVDGEVFSWYGSRLLHAPAYFKQLNEALLKF